MKPTLILVVPESFPVPPDLLWKSGLVITVNEMEGTFQVVKDQYVATAERKKPLVQLAPFLRAKLAKGLDVE
jgi:hypothetical protein